MKPNNRTQQRDDALEIHGIQGLPIRALTHKPISKEVAEKYDVRVRISEENGEIEQVCYPYTDQDGNITGYKIRVLPKQFLVAGKLRGLFGQHQCKKGAKLLIITEGEDDALAAYEMLKAKGKNYNVVSVPNGASQTVDPAVAAEMEFITSHGLVVLAMDSDKPGQETAKALADIICSQSRVKILKLPKKDAGEMLKNGMADEFEKLFYTKDYSPDAIMKGSDISIELLRTPKIAGFSLPYPELERKLHGLRKAEITTFCAGSGIGKSTVTREISYHLRMKHQQRVATIALETPIEDAARAFLAIDLNIPLHRLMFQPKSIDQKAFENSYRRLLGEDQLFFFKHWGSIQSDSLIRKCHYFAKALKVDFIVLDHVSMVVAGEDTTDERKSLDMLMEKLTNLVVETGVGVINVAHLKRVQGKNYSKGDEVELTDLRGSAGLEQMSWTVIGLERDTQTEGNRKDFSRIRVLKNRTLGFTGLADTLQYHHDTGRLLPANVEY